MEATFSYTFDLSQDTKIIRFEKEPRVEFIVMHEVTWMPYGNSVFTISVQHSSEKDVLIVAEICSGIDSEKKCARLENGAAVFNFQNINLMTHDPWRCIIHAVPHVELQDLQDAAMFPTPVAETDEISRKVSKLEELSADLQQALSSGDLSDVILTDGDIQIPAHKVILSARSLVFSRMFQHTMKENRENTVLITDIPVEVLKELVSFMYTGTVTIVDVGVAKNLYVAADKYAVKDLKALCSDMLKNVTCDDVLDILALAELYEDTELKQTSLDFISRNYSMVKNSKTWKQFAKENQTLTIEILSFILERKT